MRRLLILCTAAAILLLLLAAQALPHDYWLEPERFFLPAGGGRVRVRMHVGEHLKSEAARPLQKARTADFRMFSSAGAEDLLSPAREGQMPVAEVTLARDGNYLFVMERKATEIKLDAEKFRAYLVEEGLEPIIAARERAGESGREGRERYSRYLKSLVQVGGRHDATYGRKVGHRLEITPLVNPYALRPGASLPGLVE
ncbi:MAG: DUF4198 domain-containing protein, partial [Pyrinomonadaceae bacterium]